MQATEKLTTPMPEQQFRDVRVTAAIKGMSMAEYNRLALKEQLKKDNPGRSFEYDAEEPVAVTSGAT